MDYKVTTDEARAERYEEQLRVYSLAGRGEGLEVKAAYLHELRDGTRKSVDISDNTTRFAMNQVNDRMGALRRSAFTPKPEVDRCSACEYQGICAHATPADGLKD